MVALIGGLSGCASLEPGGCANRGDDGGFDPADCAEAEFRVLARLDAPGTRCEDVAGVSNSHSDGDRRVCLGPRDVDPATAVNVVGTGECVTDVDVEPVRRADCAETAAVNQVLLRTEQVFEFEGPCLNAPGTTDTYTWSLQPEEGAGFGQREIVFCLAPKGLDPTRSTDVAQPGDCLSRGAGDTLFITYCADPVAEFRVLHRDDGLIVGPEVSCTDEPGYTATLQRDRGGIGNQYLLCLGPATP